MPTTVISYRAPASYRRCGDTLYNTRGAKYVAMRENGSSARFVAVRNYAPRTRYIAVRSAPRTKYVAVRKVDFDDDDLRYVAVRRDLRRPEAGIRHIAVRSGYREGNGIVAYVDSEPRYVAVRRIVPRTRYVAVRNIDIDYDEPRYIATRTVAPRTRYIAVRNTDSGCTRAVALRNCLDKIETTSVRRVVLRDDEDYVSTKHVVLRDEIDDDDDIIESEIDDDDEAYVAVPMSTTKYVQYTPAAYSNGNGVTYIAANDFANTCSQPVAVRTCRPDVVSARTIAYEVSDDDDVDDQAFLHDDGATYVATGDMEDACLSRQVVYTKPEVVTTRAVSYVPEQYVDEDASLMVSEPTYVVNRTTVTQPRWVALDEDQRFDDLDPTWVDEVEGSGLGTVSYVPGGDVEVGGQAVSYVPFADVEEMDTQAVSYVPVADTTDVEPVSYLPVDDVEELDTQTVSYVPIAETSNVETVSYVPVDEVEDIDTAETVSYVPVNDTNVSMVSYVPVSGVDNFDATYIAADDDACPILVSSVNAEPTYVADASTVFVEEVDDELVAGLRSTRQIAGQFGYRDGFEDGKEAALEGDLYHPENSGDFEKATEGYEDDFGDKDVYKDGYRTSYLEGYRAGFESADSSA
jgi:hypothetical protein